MTGVAYLAVWILLIGVAVLGHVFSYARMQKKRALSASVRTEQTAAAFFYKGHAYDKDVFIGIRAKQFSDRSVKTLMRMIRSREKRMVHSYHREYLLAEIDALKLTLSYKNVKP